MLDSSLEAVIDFARRREVVWLDRRTVAPLAQVLKLDVVAHDALKLFVAFAVIAEVLLVTRKVLRACCACAFEVAHQAASAASHICSSAIVAA